MRTFLAVPIPEEVRKAASALINNLQGGNFKIVKPENYHLTLKFLGERTDEEVNAIKEALTPTTNAFTAALSGLGAFPSLQHIKVIWVGLGQGKQEYINLFKEADTQLTQTPQLKSLNIRPERDYTPHLTIARVRTVSDKEALQKFLSAPFISEPFQITEIHMMKSELAPEGPTYTKLFTLPLPNNNP